MEETLGFRNPVDGEKAATKKKVRVVKKIVKKKVIKKVLKRVSLASDCNNLEKVPSANADVDSHVEIGKPNFDVDGLKEAEDVKELEGVHLVGTSDSCRDESQISGLVTSSLLGDQIYNKLQDSDQNQIEFMESDQNQFELKDSDQSRIKLMDINQNQIKLQDSDQNQIELQDSDHNETKLLGNDQNTIALLDSALYQDRIELQDSDQNRIELLDREHGTNTMNVEEHEGEEGVKEVTVNSETDGLKSQEAFISESKVLSGKMVASRVHMKQITKILIHGLGQKTKEEDIRKVFEELGEVVEVKITNLKTGKAGVFAFIRFTSAVLANLALTKYQNVEICGRPCQTAAIEGINTILLDNIDKKWNNENVVELLQKIGIKKIDEVLVVPDSDHTELNCGFAFLEFETKEDAQMAYHQLQNETGSGKHSNIKVSWSSPPVNPVKEEVKSVYAEHIPLFWDEKEVNNHFKMFGEIESIALAKNLRTAKRNDFAFINYKTREAALSCIKALTCKKLTSNNDPMGHLKVSLTKSTPKVKPIKTTSDYAVTKVSQAYQKANLLKQSQNQYLQPAYQSRQSQQNMSLLGVHKLPQKLNNMIGKHEDSTKDVASSTTAELVHLLREQASWKHGGPSSTAGMSTLYHQQPSSGGKQPIIEQGSKSFYHHDHQAYHQSHLQIPSGTHPRPVANMTSIPRYDQQRAHYTLGSFSMGKPDPRYFQTRDETAYPGSSSIYRQMH